MLLEEIKINYSYLAVSIEINGNLQLLLVFSLNI